MRADWRLARPSQRPICVVMVVFNASAHLPKLLASLRDEGNHPAQIIAIDNGSTDDSLAILSAAQDVVWFAQDNTGFAHGVNRGIALSRPDADILVLNPDVVLQPGALQTLAGVLDRCPDAGIVAPQLIDESGAVLPSCRRFPSASRNFVEAFVGGSRAGRFGEAYTPGAEAHDVDWATGAVLLLRRSMLDRIGGLEEAFFLYSEETELCDRAKRQGYRSILEPRASVLHVGGGLGTNPQLWALRAINRSRRYRASKGPLRGAAFRASAVLFEFRRALMGDPLSPTAIRSLTRKDLDAEAERLAVELGGQPEPMREARRTHSQASRNPASNRRGRMPRESVERSRATNKKKQGER